MDIGQGNFLTPEQRQQIEVGMSRSQVEFVLGSPSIIDPYKTEVWIYNYFRVTGEEQRAEANNLTLTFSGDSLQSINDQYPDDPEMLYLPQP